MECTREQGGELLALSAADVKRILKVYFCWRDLPIDDVLNVSLLQKGCECLCNSSAMLLRSVSPIFRRLRPSSLCLVPVLHPRPFPPNGLSPASSWQYIVSTAWSKWAHTLKLPTQKWAHTLWLPTQTPTCSAFVDMPLNPPVHFHRLMYSSVWSPN